MLRGKDAQRFFSKMYGNKPRLWKDDLDGAKRLRFITNVFTRMRYLNSDGKLDFTVNRSPRRYLRRGLTPWVTSWGRRCSWSIGGRGGSPLPMGIPSRV